MDTTALEPVMHVSAAEQVYRHAKDGILARRYRPNELLTEGDLAAAVGVSRTPVREALLRLQTEGLVRLLPKRGALVLAVTPQEAADVMQVRRLIETFAARSAAAAHRAELTERLGVHLDRMRAAAKAHDARGYLEADREFHTEIVEATGNALMLDIYQGLRDRQLRMGANLLGGDQAPDPARMRAMISEHEAIAAAISGRSLRAAEAAVTAHLDHAEQQLVRA